MEIQIKYANFVLMKAYVHILFWVMVLFLLSFIFQPYFSSFSETFYFVAMLLPVAIVTSYFFNLFLVPRFLLTRRYGKFALYIVYMLIISLYLEMIVIMASFMLLAEYSYDNMSPVSSDIFVLAVTIYFIVLLFSFILLIRHLFQKEKAIVALEDEKKKIEPGSISIRSERQMKTLPFDDILFIESLGDYVRIHLRNGKELWTKEKISRLEERLPDIFVRVHRSFIVHKFQVSSFSRERVRIGDQTIPISRKYREAAWSRLS